MFCSAEVPLRPIEVAIGRSSCGRTSRSSRANARLVTLRSVGHALWRVDAVSQPSRAHAPVNQAAGVVPGMARRPAPARATHSPLRVARAPKGDRS